MGKLTITNRYDANLLFLQGDQSDLWEAVEDILRRYGASTHPERIAYYLNRLGCWRTYRGRDVNDLDDLAALERELSSQGEPDTPMLPEPPPTPMAYGDHRGDFLNPFFGPARLGGGMSTFEAYLAVLDTRGDNAVLVNAEQDPWMVREGHPEWGWGFDVYANQASRNRLVEALDVAWNAYGLAPHVGIIDQPTLRRHYWHGWEQILNMTTELMSIIKGKASLVMPSWECGEVMSDGTAHSHVQMEDRLVEWCALIHKIDPKVWVGIHHADGLRGGNIFYGRLGTIMGERGCRYMQYSQDDTDSDLKHKTRLIRDVADRTGTSICIMEHSSPVRLGTTYTKQQADRRARVCAEELEPTNRRHWNFMNGY